MRVAWIVPRYPPVAPAGAEWTAHELLVELARRGHHAAAVVTGRERHAYHNIAGVDDVVVWTAETAGGEYDVVIGHLGYADQLRDFVRRGGRGRVVWMAHAAYQYAWGSDAAPDAWIANSEHVRAAGPPGTWIMRPHTPRARSVGGICREGHGDAILLVGATDMKGLPLVRRIARAMPWRSFIVVQSGYDRQRIAVGRRGNIDVWPMQTHGLRDAFAESRLVLVPSIESWGRVAVEAAHCGIPTIANPSVGIVEAMGAGGFVPAPADSVSAWLRAIERLDDPDVYRTMRLAAIARAHYVEETTRRDRDRIIDRLEAAA